ncbi:MAG: transporter substrate-binding domain-containing protein [Myxococcales bacterium]
MILADDPNALRETGDLDAIRARGVLRVLVTGSEERFLPRQGMPDSYDRELARELGRRLGLDVRFVMVPDHDRLIPALSDGLGDLIAAQLTVTDARKDQMRFTHPLATIDEVLVTAKGSPDAPKDIAGLAGRKVFVAATPHAESVEALEEKAPGIEVARLDEPVDAEELVYRASRGKIPLTVVDSHVLAAIEAYNDRVQRLFAIATGRQIAWAVRKESPQLGEAIDTFLVEKALTRHADRLFTGDLDEIRKRGALRVLTRNNPVTYFLHRGEQRGFDFELAQMIARQLGVRLEMVVPPSRDQLIPWLLEGRGDMIAASMTVTAQRESQVAFSRPYLFVEEVLVQPASEPRIASLAELEGREVHVRPSSSYVPTLTALKQRVPGLKLVDAPESAETEELIARVAAGEIPLTAADSHILKAELAYRDDIQAGPQVELEAREEPVAWDDLTKGRKRIAFAVRPGNPQLKEYLDAFVAKTYRGLEYNMARKRYFENPRRIAQAKAERVGEGGRLSPYDELIRKYAAKYGLDWRLMAALAYQESRFDPTVKSWAGAVGLFQLMPSTAREMGFERPEDPEQGTNAGIRYLSYLLGRFDPKLPLQQRLRFAMAAYNAGFGHVEDARRLAESLGLNPDRWFGNVEKAMLLLERPEHYRKTRYGYCRGSEPVRYVSEIQNRYDNWVKLVKQ